MLGSFRKLTFHGELLLDILEVVGVLAVNRASGSLDRHIGAMVLVNDCFLVGIARYGHFAGGVFHTSSRATLQMTQRFLPAQLRAVGGCLTPPSRMQLLSTHPSSYIVLHLYHRLHLRRALETGWGALASVHDVQNITHCSRVRRPYQACFDSCILLSRFIPGDFDQKDAVLRCNNQTHHKAAQNPEGHSRTCHDRSKKHPTTDHRQFAAAVGERTATSGRKAQLLRTAAC